MSMSNNDLSATIVNMMNVLNPRLRRKSDLPASLDFISPLKRRASLDRDESVSLDSGEKRPKLNSSFNTSGSSSNLDTNWLSSPRESRRMRSELIEARGIILNLENRIKNVHCVRKELQLMFDNEIKSYQQQHERDRKTVDDLESQLQTIRHREQDLKNELEEVKNSVNVQKVNYETRFEQLELELTKVQSELKLNESLESDDLTQLRNRVVELEMLVDAAEKDANAHKELAKDLETRLAKLSAVERDLEMKEQVLLKAQLRAKDLEYTLESYGEWQQQSKIQQRKLTVFPELEKETQRLRDEVKNLREQVRNKLILEEEVYDLKSRLEKCQEQEKKFAALQSSHTHLENLVEEWRSIAHDVTDKTDISDLMLPKHIRQCIEKLQQQELTLTSEKLQIESQFKQTQHEMKQAKQELERNTKQMSDLQKSQQSYQGIVHRLQKKLMLVSRERDSYRQQLDSYEKELTVNITLATTTTASGVSNNNNNQQQQQQITTQKERIENLEKIVEGYRDMINNLESELQKSQPQLLNAENIVPVRTEQTNRMQELIDRLQSENNRLTERCDQLQIQLEKQMNNNSSGKVLHLQMNPISECIADNEANVEKLQTEVDRLKRKIRQMEDGLETSKLSQTMCSSREVNGLREQLNTSEVKMQRLKECFKKSTQEFRNACYTLFGYKIDKNYTQYKLSSMYAESPDDFLEFHLNEDGNFDLLETPFSVMLKEMVELHLEHQSSIPVFLSTVTMDLFNRTTMAS